jgi:hypothetical protein
LGVQKESAVDDDAFAGLDTVEHLVGIIAGTSETHRAVAIGPGREFDPD